MCWSSKDLPILYINTSDNYYERTQLGEYDFFISFKDDRTQQLPIQKSRKLKLYTLKPKKRKQKLRKQNTKIESLFVPRKHHTSISKVKKNKHSQKKKNSEIPNLNTVKNLKRFSHVYQRESTLKKMIQENEQKKIMNKKKLMNIDIKKMQRNRRRRSSLIPGMLRPLTIPKHSQKNSGISVNKTKLTASRLGEEPKVNIKPLQTIEDEGDSQNVGIDKLKMPNGKQPNKRGRRASLLPRKSVNVLNLNSAKSRLSLVSQNQNSSNQIPIRPEFYKEKQIDFKRKSRFQQDEKRRRTIWKRQFKSCDFVSNLQIGEKMKRLKASNNKFLKQTMMAKQKVPLLVYHKRYLALHEILNNMSAPKPKRKVKKTGFRKRKVIIPF